MKRMPITSDSVLQGVVLKISCDIFRLETPLCFLHVNALSSFFEFFSQHREVTFKQGYGDALSREENCSFLIKLSPICRGSLKLYTGVSSCLDSGY